MKMNAEQSGIQIAKAYLNSPVTTKTNKHCVLYTARKKGKSADPTGGTVNPFLRIDTLHWFTF